MNQTRSFLLIAWLFVAGWLLMEWNKGPAPVTPPVAGVASPAATTAMPAPLPGAAPAPLPLPGAAPAAPGAANPVATAPAAAAQRLITLGNDRLRLTVDLAGGRVLRAQLLQYTREKKPGSPNVQLFDDAPASFYVADAGLIALDGKQAQQELPMQFQVEGGGSEFVLADGDKSLSVPLTWTDPATGLSVRRTLALARGSYVLELQDTVANTGVRPQQLYPFVRLARVAPPAPPKHSFMTDPDSFSFVGAAWNTPTENFQKTPFSDYSDEVPPGGENKDAWIGMLQHHFVTAWVPPAEQQQLVQTSVVSQGGLPLYQIRSVATPLVLAPGAQGTRSSRLWIGPKLQAPMTALAPTLKLSVDYGVLTAISQPLFWLLAKLHMLLGNWGWAIVGIVVVLRAALYPLSKKQYQSMAKMRAVQPRMEALKERYGEDKQALNVAMIELFKKEKINPAGGCLPILIQMPIFFALYWVLVETVEFRHAAWIGWIQNLSGPDPYFVLPALNLAVMYLTQKLTPTPGMDPLQKKMMQTMPLVFGVMMAFFPAGLVLYWVTNGALGLLQQWWMTRAYGPGKPTVPTVSR